MSTPTDLPKVAFLDIAILNKDTKEVEKKLGRITINLFPNCPKTIRNFGAICNGFEFEEPFVNRNGHAIKRLHYKGNSFHRIINRFMAQGGDVSCDGNLAKTSIYGGPFEDESPGNYHAKFRVSMANSGPGTASNPGTNSSQFFINFRDNEHLDGKHTVFGIVEDMTSQDIISTIECYATSDGTPTAVIQIEDSGVLEWFTEDEVKKAKMFY